MVDSKPYRPNVGIALFNASGNVLIGRRFRGDGPAIGGDPEAATGQLACQIGRHHGVRPGHEADQPRFVHHLAGDEVASLAGALRQGHRR